MPKRRPAFDPRQPAFTFDVPEVARHSGDLAGLSRMMSSAVSRILSEDGRAREVLAAEVSALLGDELSLASLNGYSSEAHDQHNIPAHRWLALIAVTKRFDVLDAMLTRIGARALVGSEMATARLGHLHAQRAELDRQIRMLKPMAGPIERANGSRGHDQ